ncbi:hypothetical protein BU17DRAFT_15697, partial [Hysterangium stoloniferum]
HQLSLFFADLVQGLGQVLSVRWISTGKVVCSTHCTAQGAIQQIGDTAVGLSTMAIALHTFNIIFFRRGSGNLAKKVALFFVIVIWLFVILFASIEVGRHNKGPDGYITPTPYWCWIGSKYDRFRVGAEYVWFWITAVLSVIIYALLYFCLRGIIVVGRDYWWQIHLQKPPSSRSRLQTALAQSNGGTPECLQSNETLPRSRQDSATEAFKMLLYPLSYILVIFGISIFRFAYKKKAEENKIPSGAIFAVDSLFAMSGILDVALWLSTRRHIVLI